MRTRTEIPTGVKHAKRFAGMVGCQPAEIAFTRSGSDALQPLITNYNNIKAGDAVIYCDLDL
jgi:selenocysteine lyase/cysteine desulfurase